MVMAFPGTWGSPKKSLAASTRVTLSRYTALVRVSLADLHGIHQAVLMLLFMALMSMVASLG